MLSWHQTSFILRYQYDNLISRIRKQFSIEWYGQNKVPYGPKHALYRKNLCQTLFGHETSFPSSKIHQNGTIWIGKPFSIDLKGQNQVPYDQNEALYLILSKIIDCFDFWGIVYLFFWGGDSLMINDPIRIEKAIREAFL